MVLPSFLFYTLLSIHTIRLLTGSVDRLAQCITDGKYPILTVTAYRPTHTPEHRPPTRARKNYQPVAKETTDRWRLQKLPTGGAGKLQKLPTGGACKHYRPIMPATNTDRWSLQKLLIGDDLQSLPTGGACRNY